MRAWHKAKDKPAVDDLIKSIEAAKQSEQWQKDGGQYIPNPATWLNQGRWEDEPPAPPGRIIEAVPGGQVAGSSNPFAGYSANQGG